MSGIFIKTGFAIVITLILQMIAVQVVAQTGILNSNIQIRASFRNTPIAWASDKVSINVNRQTGEFEATLLVNDLYEAVPNPDFTGATGENIGKYLILKADLPINDVLVNMNSVLDRQVEVTAYFNDISYHSNFTFSILKIQTGGFSVMANGPISIGALEIYNLRELDDELVIFLSFTGY